MTAAKDLWSKMADTIYKGQAGSISAAGNTSTAMEEMQKQYHMQRLQEQAHAQIGASPYVYGSQVHKYARFTISEAENGYVVLNDNGDTYVFSDEQEMVTWVLSRKGLRNMTAPSAREVIAQEKVR